MLKYVNLPQKVPAEKHSQIDELQTVFILGRGRSGSSLLSRMLNNHPHLYVAPESLFIMNLYARHRQSQWHKQELTRFFADLWLEPRMAQFWKLSKHKDQLRDTLLSWGKRATYNRLCKSVYYEEAQQRKKRNIKYIGTKDHSYTFFAEELRQIFPRSKFILLVRDYRGNISAYKESPWDFNHTGALAQRWYGFNKTALHIHDKYPDTITTVRFEDMLYKPEETLKALCTFLNIPFDTAMLQQKTPQKVEAFNNPLVNQPLAPSEATRWRRELKPQDIAIAERICGQLGRQLGYEPQKARPSGIGILANVMWGRIIGQAANRLERMVFLLPLRLRMFIINVYRLMTRTLPKSNKNS